MKILIVLFFSSLVICSGCGQTGPLTLPLDEKKSSDTEDRSKKTDKTTP